MMLSHANVSRAMACFELSVPVLSWSLNARRTAEACQERQQRVLAASGRLPG